MTLKQKNLNHSEVAQTWKQAKNDSLFVNTPWDESQHIKKKFLDLD